jgi:hypothetical protein
MAMIKALRLFTILFSAMGFYLLLRRYNFAFQIIPMAASGHEGGIIEIAVDTLYGMGASFIAVILAFIHLQCSDSNKAVSMKFAKLLLAFCCVLLLGFFGAFFL